MTTGDSHLSSNENPINLTLHVEYDEHIDADTVDRLTRALAMEMRALDIESVTTSGPGVAAPPGTKAIDPFSLGALFVGVLPEALPKVLEYIYAWATRGANPTVKIKAQRGDRLVEVEYPKSMALDDVEQHVTMVLRVLGDDAPSS